MVVMVGSIVKHPHLFGKGRGGCVASIRKRLLASETPRDTQSSLGVSGDSKDIEDLNILP